MDLFNCTPQLCEGTEIKTARKGIPAILLITRSLKKFARTPCVFWRLKSLNACLRVT